MLNGLLNTKFDQSDVYSMLTGHHLFLQKNTGQTNNAQLQHYVLNNEGVLSNNRHFIAEAQMEAQPNGDATTEGQAVLIIGYAYACMATGNKEYYDAAVKYFNAYIDNFYGGQPIPDSPQRYISNWIVNGKEPILANWPVDFESPTHSGFKGVMMNFVNGKTQIPHGAPYWGEYLDKSTFAFDGSLGWDSIVATVYGLKSDGVTTDWNSKGQQYDVDWLISYLGHKVDWDGNVLETGLDPSLYGTVQLKDTSIQGQHKLNWGNCQPVEHGGYLIGRNETWHNRPLRVPVGTSKDGERQYNQYGNSSDSEQWFGDAAYLLYKLADYYQDSNASKYRMVWQCVLQTCLAYSEIDQKDKFFRASVTANSPFTDGISYDFTYPDTVEAMYIRDANGYVDVNFTEACSHTMEQQAVWPHVNQESAVRTAIAGKTTDGRSPAVNVTIKVAPQKETPEAAWTTWSANFVIPADLNVRNYDIKLKDFLQASQPDGQPFTVADSRVMVYYGAGHGTIETETGVLDSRTVQVAKGVLPDSSSGMIVGFWLLDSNRLTPRAITVKTTTATELHFYDSNRWKWHWNLGSTGGNWRTVNLNPSALILNEYQADHSESEPRPSSPSSYDTTQVEFQLGSGVTAGSIDFYCMNTPPKLYDQGTQFIKIYSLTVRDSDDAFNFKLGDCDVQNALAGNLYCTPGVIPFSNISSDGSKEEFDGWHGMPYPGYQYPFIYLDGNHDLQMNNMIEFLYQSQVWYTNKFGVVGPGASAYIWNRWDNYKYGEPDTWTMYHWGNGTAWSGYQPRAFFGAARVWYELVIQKKPVPEKLKIYVTNWIKFLVEFTLRTGISPTDFPPDRPPAPLEDDFTGHMCGLWLAGSCIAHMAGARVEGLEKIIEIFANELNENYKITPVPNHVMNGSWSPGLRLDTGSGPESNGMFFGFWAGEIMRGLGLYLIYKRIATGEDMYLMEGV